MLKLNNISPMCFMDHDELESDQSYWEMITTQLNVI